MALNLIRNSRLFFTTNVNATTGVVQAAGHSATTTFEIQVLDGFSLSQNSNNETVTVSEAGTSPVRGQRSFNTSLAPVDFSFSTYIRPRFSTNVLAEEGVLWNALAGITSKGTVIAKSGTFTSFAYVAATNILTIAGTTMSVTGLAAGQDIVINGGVLGTGTLGDVKVANGAHRVLSVAAGTITLQPATQGAADFVAGAVNITNIAFYYAPWSESPNVALLGFHESNKNQLQKFGLLVVLDGVSYQIDNAAMGQATIDFGLDGIATIQWTGQATVLTQIANTITTNTPGTFGGGTISGTYLQKVTTANYITTKLTTAALKTVTALGAIPVDTPYYIAITGGSISINNNISYVTPANLGTVNTAIGYYTGTRAISGSLNAYLNTGAVTGYTGGGTGNLLKDMLAAASTVTEPMFAVELAIGGSSNAVRVELAMPSVSLGVPAINTEQVVSTTINFNASPSNLASTETYDLNFTNDLLVRYYSN